MITQRFKDRLMKIPEYKGLFEDGYEIAMWCHSNQTERKVQAYENLGAKVAVRPFVIEAGMQIYSLKNFIFVKGRGLIDGIFSETTIDAVITDQFLRSLKRRKSR